MIRTIYYTLKPGLPRKFQIFLHRFYIMLKWYFYRNSWPIDYAASQIPINWNGWPENKKFALLLTHDVEWGEAQAKCYKLAEMEKRLGFRSAFYLVPERYDVSPEVRNYLTENGFEVGVHGLKHDGKLYKSRKIFNERAVKINAYLKEWKAVGFRSPAMHHNLEWIHELDIEYDASTFDTDPFEPQPDGVRTIFPFQVTHADNPKSYWEFPYTLPQDSTLFLFMGEKNIDIWKRKLDWIVENGGMALINLHPDYMNFESDEWRIEEYPVHLIEEFLNYIKEKYEGQYWNVLPRELCAYCNKSITG